MDRNKAWTLKRIIVKGILYTICFLLMVFGGSFMYFMIHSEPNVDNLVNTILIGLFFILMPVLYLYGEYHSFWKKTDSFGKHEQLLDDFHD